MSTTNTPASLLKETLAKKAARQKVYRERNKDKVSADRKAWREQRLSSGKCPQCGDGQITLFAKHYCPSCILKMRLRSEKYRYNLKSEMIAAYGGACSCCGESSREFLTIDHINGCQIDVKSGKRRKAGNRLKDPHGVPMWARLKKLGWPKDEYRLLCINCNFSLGKYGYCPHQRKSLELVS